MQKMKQKKKTYSGKNIRISEKAFDKIKEYTDEAGYKIGRFVEGVVVKEIEKIKLNEQK